jgi:hypothetical protein
MRCLSILRRSVPHHPRGAFRCSHVINLRRIQQIRSHSCSDTPRLDSAIFYQKPKSRKHYVGALFGVGRRGLRSRRVIDPSQQLFMVARADAKKLGGRGAPRVARAAIKKKQSQRDLVGEILETEKPQYRRIIHVIARFYAAPNKFEWREDRKHNETFLVTSVFFVDPFNGFGLK